MTGVPLAVIGCGMIGLRHAEVAMRSGKVDLSAVVEPDTDLRQRLRRDGLPAVATLDEVPPHTRAAIVATPTPDHCASGLAALDRGWAVLVEKPLAGSLAEADLLIDKAAARGLPLVTGHHRRCHPFVRATAARLARIGRPVAVQGLWSLRKHDSYYDPDWRRKPGAGPLMTNLSHEIDLLRHFMGGIAEVSALSSNALRGLEVEDTAAISIRFENGALGSFLISDAGASPWSFEAACGENPEIASSGQDYVTFTGTGGAMSFPSLALWLGERDQDVTWHSVLQRHDGDAFDTIDPIAAQIDHFADLIEGQGGSVLATGEDGRATLEATLAAVLSAQARRPIARGEVPLAYRGLTTSGGRL